MAADGAFTGSTAFWLELGYLPSGDYLLTLEYFSEAGVRAAIIDQPFAVQTYTEPPRRGFCGTPP